MRNNFSLQVRHQKRKNLTFSSASATAGSLQLWPRRLLLLDETAMATDVSFVSKFLSSQANIPVSYGGSCIEQDWLSIICGFQLHYKTKKRNMNLMITRWQLWTRLVQEIRVQFWSLHQTTSELYVVVFLSWREKWAEIKETIKAIWSVTVTAALMTGLGRQLADVSEAPNETPVL